MLSNAAFQNTEEFFYLGSHRIDPNVILAPMAGYTDRIYRKLIDDNGGCGLFYSEMIPVEGLIRNPGKYTDYFRCDDLSSPLAVQIFGSRPRAFAEAAQILEDRNCQSISINMGCPVKKIVKNGDGSALMKDPSLAGKIIEQTVKNTSAPVTVKCRSGWDEETINAGKIADMAEARGASAFCLHPRTKKEHFSGKADWNLIAEISGEIDIPVIGNGDIDTPEKAREMFRETGCRAVMIGRSALRNPWIFKQIKEFRNTGNYRNYKKEKLENLLRKHFDLLKEKKGEKRASKLIRSYVSYYSKGVHNAGKMRKMFNTASGTGDFNRIMEEMFDGKSKE